MQGLWESQANWVENKPLLQEHVPETIPYVPEAITWPWAHYY